MHRNAGTAKIIILLSLLIFCSMRNLQGQSSEDSNPVISVLTYNIYHGETMLGNFDLDIIAKVLKESGADLIALQEVDFKTKRAKGYDLATELGHRIGYLPFFASAMSYDGGEYGEAILSRFSALSTRKIHLPNSEGNEPRTALEVAIELPSGDTIYFVGTHLDHTRDPADRIAQGKTLASAFKQNGHPGILAGDLNALPGSTTMKEITKFWNTTALKDPLPTFPAKDPQRKIDYILVHPAERWQVLHTQTICDTIASDHCGYLITLKLKNIPR
jgi:endonuclease/exonuclease/phosphatase family metal-dependent hydrolase